jgi:hypothetical protein
VKWKTAGICITFLAEPLPINTGSVHTLTSRAECFPRSRFLARFCRPGHFLVTIAGFCRYCRFLALAAALPERLSAGFAGFVDVLRTS